MLSALLDAGHDVVGVYTRPDKPAGRGKRPTAPPVKQHAADRGLRVFQPASLRSEQVQSELASLSPDVVAVAAYGLFLPDPMLAAPPLGLPERTPVSAAEVPGGPLPWPRPFSAATP